jgi:hypothetical protein
MTSKDTRLFVSSNKTKEKMATLISGAMMANTLLRFSRRRSNLRARSLKTTKKSL